MYHLFTESSTKTYRHADAAIEAAVEHIQDALTAGILYAKAIITDDDSKIVADYYAEDYI